MRTIKFRCWDKDFLEMSDKVSFSGRVGQYPIINDGIKDLQNNGSVLMQFTGLKDSKGVEIYEGDVLKHSQGVDKVWWDKDRWSLGEWTPGEIDESMEVIGNIYSNPELIN